MFVFKRRIETKGNATFYVDDPSKNGSYYLVLRTGVPVHSVQRDTAVACGSRSGLNPSGRIAQQVAKAIVATPSVPEPERRAVERWRQLHLR